MLKIINSIIDSIFPPRVDERLVRSLPSKEVASLYMPGTSNGVLFLSRYKNPAVQALIKENKYHHSGQAAFHLATLLQQWLLTRPENTLLLIPIPLGSKRRRLRGHNQVLSIIKSLPPSTTYFYDEHLLVRARETVTQTSLKKSQRQHNLKEAFVVSKHLDLDKLRTTVILIDDVVTTGATLQAAKAALSQHLPPATTIISLALAH